MVESVVLKLLFLDGSDKSLWLAGPALTIGSGPRCHLKASGRGVRELHAELLIQGDKLTLRSAPGACVVNKLPVDAEYPLSAGDELQIGDGCWRVVDPKQGLDVGDALTSLDTLSRSGHRTVSRVKRLLVKPDLV